MEMFEIIVIVSIIMWYIIDKAKALWSEFTYGKYLTIAVAAVLAFFLCFGYRLDLMVALGVVNESSTLGTVLTVLTLMSGSSAVSELMGKLKK